MKIEGIFKIILIGVSSLFLVFGVLSIIFGIIFFIGNSVYPEVAHFEGETIIHIVTTGFVSAVVSGFILIQLIKKIRTSGLRLS